MNRNRSPRLSRRRLLQGICASGVLAPFVPLLDSHAALGEFPKRLLLFYTPNGTVLSKWRPTGSGSNWQLSDVLKPLAPYKDKVVVLDGVDNVAITTGPGVRGHQGTGTLWTGTELQEGDLFVEGNDNPSGWAGGISVDQQIAQKLGSETVFSSLELGVYVTGDAAMRNRMSYKGPGQPLPPDSDPKSVFDRVFGSFSVGSSELERLRAERETVLSLVKDELSTLEKRVSSEDRQKLQGHLASVQAIEARLGKGALAGCVPPDPTTLPAGNPTSSSNVPVMGKAQIDLMVAALACDLTRVGSFFWTRETSGPKHTWIGQDEGHHTISHYTDDAGKQKAADITRWYAEQFAYLCKRLSEVPEGDGTLLDNTVICWGSPISNGFNHSNRNVPIVLAGGAGGAIRTNQYLKFGSFPDDSGSNDDHGGQSNNNLLLSLCHAMGLTDLTSFGNPVHCTGVIPGLLV